MPYSPEQIVESSHFKRFLVTAKGNAYPNPGPDARVVSTTGGGREISYTEAPLTYVDHYVGGNPYGGHEFVSLKTQVASGDVDVPIWNMSYYETDYDSDNVSGNQIREILGKALILTDAELPLRGAQKARIGLSEGDEAQYTFEPEQGSTLAGFSAEETIELNGRRVYVARFMGGVINKDKSFEDTM